MMGVVHPEALPSSSSTEAATAAAVVAVAETNDEGEQQQQQQQHSRYLGSGDDGGYLVDADGNSYAPYSLSWRYLGVFIDNCDDDDRKRRANRNRNRSRNRNRKLEDNNDNNNSCRKVLWAAYHDPGYTGGSIAEYKFYDKVSGTWDGSTCKARRGWHGLWNPTTRCQRLDCHEAHTKFELVGVFKESDGLYDFTEQLFKHQGYCLWDADKSNGNGNGSGDGSGSGDNNGSSDDGSSSDYNFMTNLAENWVDGCTQHDSAVDADGNALYYDTKPLAGGDITYGVYTDGNCLTESTSVTWSDIVASDNNNDDNDNNNNGMTSAASFDRWNSLLSDYKICQPCRAYNRVRTNDGSGDSGSGDNNNNDDDYNYYYDNYDSEDSGGDYEDGDDGEGGKERYGFNCYDAAGYLNCNQCYKFQTQTSMQAATYDDLERATQQGTILAISLADGTTYGKGHFAAPGRAVRVLKKTSGVFLSTMALVGLGYFYYWKKWGKQRQVDNAGLNERLHKSSIPDSFFSFGNPPISPTGSTTVESPTKQSTKKEKREKKLLVAQLRERDTKLSEQEKLIQQLQQKLDYYESKKDNVSPQADAKLPPMLPSGGSPKVDDGDGGIPQAPYPPIPKGFSGTAAASSQQSYYSESSTGGGLSGTETNSRSYSESSNTTTRDVSGATSSQEQSYSESSHSNYTGLATADGGGRPSKRK